MSKELEDILKAKLEAFEVQPSGGLFDAIQAKRKKKKVAVWWWTAASVALLGVLVAFWGLNNSSDSPAVIDAPEIEEVTPEVPQESHEVESAIVQEEIDTQLEPVTSPVPTLDPTPALPLRDQSTYGSYPGDVTPPEQTTSPIQDIVVDERLAQRFAEIMEENKEVDPNKAKLHVRDRSLDVNRRDEVANVIESKPVIEEDKAETPEHFVFAEEAETPDTADQNAQNNSENNTTKISPWRFELSGGIGYAYRIIEGPQNYTELRNEADQARLSSMVDARIAYQLSPKWSLQSGINFMQRTEQFNSFESEMHINERIEQEERVIIHPVLGEIKQMVDVTYYDTSWVQGAAVSATNKYNSVQIPLELERAFYFGSRWTVLSKAGVQFTIHQNVTGMSINDQLQTVAAESLSYQNGISRISFGVGAGYTVNDKVMIMLYPQGSLALQNGLDLPGIKQKDFGVFSQLGLRVRL